jgi:hypothetical protein
MVGRTDAPDRRRARAALIALFVDLVWPFAGADRRAAQVVRTDDDRRLARARRYLCRQRGILGAVVRLAGGDRRLGNYRRTRARRVRAIQAATECSNPNPAARP